jgi:5-amino-6-(5-phosphoribosylamino)uracil reductase
MRQLLPFPRDPVDPAELYGDLPRSCRLDWDSPFFTAAIAPPIVITVAEAPARERKKAADLADVTIAGEQDVDLAAALGALADRGYARVLAEGAPAPPGPLLREVYSEDQVVSNEGYRVRPPSTNSVWPVM